jgi:hypothetical protein
MQSPHNTHAASTYLAGSMEVEDSMCKTGKNHSDCSLKDVAGGGWDSSPAPPTVVPKLCF